MESYEYIKNKRELLGLSVRDFAKLADTSPSNLFYYETGQYKLYNLSIGKFLNLFSLLEIDPDEFAKDYFEDLYKEVDDKLLEWKAANHREYSYKVLKKRYRLRIAKIAERKTLSDYRLEEVRRKFDRTFSELQECISEDIITDELYETYILPLSAFIRLSLDNGNALSFDDLDNAADRINYKLSFTDYGYRDLAFLSDITFRLFAIYRKKPDDYENIKAATAFKIAYILDSDVRNLFGTASVAKM